MKRTMFALSIAMFAFAGTASAKTTSVEAQFKNSLKASSAIQDLGAIQLSKATVVKTKLGRHDLRKLTSTKFHTVIANVKKAYRSRSTLMSGYKVVGYAKINRLNLWTVTLEKDGKRQVVQMKSLPSGTQMDFRTFTRPAPRR